MTDDEILYHFNYKPEFREATVSWEPQLKQLFCRLARAIHGTGLDIYHISRGTRFGRKNEGDDSAWSVAGYIDVTNNGIRVRSNSRWAGNKIETIPENGTNLNANLIQNIEDELKDWNGIPEDLQRKKPGLWPDEYQDHEQEAVPKSVSRTAESPSRHSLNTILYGPPGTGKTYATFRHCVEICGGAALLDETVIRDRYRELVEDNRVEFVTFHQSYGYEEFVEGLRPQTGPTETDKGGSAGFRLEPRDGVLKRIAERAQNLPSLPYVLVIDEINRGNISKVFGEAITLVEEDKRAGQHNEIAITLPYSGNPFTLPPNLYILGTMNTADRSIALLDTALRRRFDFEERVPNPELLGRVGDVDLGAVLEKMNARLEWFLSRDHLIGHAWLMSAKDRKALDRAMRNKIIPLLSEYFHEDWSNVRAVLGGGNGFIEREELGFPPDLDRADIGEKRYRWTVLENFSDNAYKRLIAGKPLKTDDTNDDGKEEAGD